MQENLEQLLADGVIDEVLGRLKSGKEADVYLVRHRGEVVAAKVYKDRDQRNFKNNSGYTEGRQIRNSRTRRAVEKGSKFGQREAEESWKSAEADTLYRLHAEGVRVPTPKMFYEGVLLMQLVTLASGEPAPRLIDAPIEQADAAAIYKDLRRALIGMLCCDLIHGDLSPYNVLLGEAGATIIDFPQTMSAAHNNRAESYFRRDFENIHRFLAAVDRSLDAARGDGQEIWRAYVRRELSPDFVPSVRARPAFQRVTPEPAPPRVARPTHAGAGFPEPRAPQGPPRGQATGQLRGPPQGQPPQFRGAPQGQQHRGAPQGQGQGQPPRNAPPNRGPRVVVPEVVYVRRGGQQPPPEQHEPRAQAEEPLPTRQPAPQRTAAPPRQAPPPHPPHRTQHRVPHPPNVAPPQGGHATQSRRAAPAVERAPEVEVRDGSDRKGPRRRRRGRRSD